MKINSILNFSNIFISRNIKQIFSWIIWKVLGSRNFARLGRFLWMQSRLDSVNDINLNGEALLQHSAIKYFKGNNPITFFDVGANVGIWTQNLIHNLKKEKINENAVEIHLFEPEPLAHKELTKTLLNLGGFKTVQINQKGVTDKCGKFSFGIIGEKAGTNSLKHFPTQNILKTIEIECISISKYCQNNNIPHVNFIKIDTEGNDYNVILGAKDLLRKGKIDLIQFEYNHRWISFRCFLKDVFDLVSPFGYSVGKVTAKGIIRFGGWDPQLESYMENNYVIWRASIIEKMGINVMEWWT